MVQERPINRHEKEPLRHPAPLCHTIHKRELPLRVPVALYSPELSRERETGKKDERLPCQRAVILYYYSTLVVEGRKMNVLHLPLWLWRVPRLLTLGE